MSKEIKCKECGYANPHSSKFCNNCGAKLPLSTHIICPNCETPNTRDRVFCDTCGTRLIPETTQLKPEEPEASQPPTNEPFSLPTRRPGETGELDPNAVPDWLRTGNIASTRGAVDVPEDDEEDEPENKGTSDLPDWLVHDSDPDPIINAPTTISTEFYQDLLDKAEDLPQPDDLFPDEEGADLPDWLSDAAGAGPQSQEPVDLNAGLTTWLRDLSDESESEDTAVPSKESDDDISGGLTDWLHDLDDLGETSDEHEAENAAALEDLLGETDDEADDWLHELGPAQTDIFAPQADEPENLEDDDLPGWMNELGPLQTDLLNPEQMAELTGPLAGLTDDDDIFADDEAGEDVSFTNLFETAGSETETLPDWLDAAAEEGETFLSDLPPELAEQDTGPEPDIVSEPGSDWFTVDQIVAETELDWLEETGNLGNLPDEAEVLEEPDAVEEFSFDALPDDLLADDEEDEFDFDLLADLADEDAEAPELSGLDDDLDWLSDMEAIQTGNLVVEPEEEDEATAVPDELELDFAEDPVFEAEPEPADDSWNSDDFFAETAVDEDLPAWLDQLDKPKEVEEASGSDSVDTELPEWIASMRPGQGFAGSELPDVLADMDLRDTLEGIPEELAGAELPDWLHGAPLDADTAPSPVSEADTEGLMEIPDWLQPEGEDAKEGGASLSDALEPPASGSGRNEWRSLLEELPPLTPLAETLPKAEIPEWVQQLKPTELSGESPREPEGAAETIGPLQGMQGVVTIEPAIARPRTAMLPTPYVTTPEQEQQVALLRQITQETPETVTTLSAKSAYGTAAWLRLSLAVLLILAVLGGLFGPDLVATRLPIPNNVQAFETAVAAAAGQPVLIAVEYTPAMAGELTPQAKLLLDQLAANNSPVLITSQYAAGTAVATELIGQDSVQMIGYLPGEGIGLRQLGDCLGQRVACEQLNGRMLEPELQTSLSQVGLIILLTGDRDNLVNWIEQVGTVAVDVPLVAGVTQALTPLASSYASTEQLSGLLGGTPDAAAYEQLVNASSDAVRTQLNAQIFGQLLAGVLLLIGLIAYGTTGLMNNRRQKK